MTKQTKKFTVRNEHFLCKNCHLEVYPAKSTCRNHCPNCLYSVHLDIFPGDRSAHCGGLMKPIRIEKHSKKGYQVVHVCLSCGYQTRNVIDLDDPIQPDSLETVLALMREQSLRE